MRRRLFLAAVVVGLLAGAFGAAGAGAALVQFNPQTGQFTYVANDAVDPTHVNGVSVFKAPSANGYVAIEDSADVPIFTDQNVIDYCYQEEYRVWACPAGSVIVKTAAGNDTITVSGSLTLPTELEGGKDSDTIHGGGGPDGIYGGCHFADCPGADTMYGGAGADAIHGYTGADGMTGQSGDDVLDGGGGGDLMYGGADKDTADYSARAGEVVVRLDNAYNDGAVGEGDNVRDDVEVVQGGSGNDVLYGNDAPNTLKGGPGDDYMDAAGGNDSLYGQSGTDLLRGGLGADYLSGGNMVNGCCQADTASWAGRANPVSASIDFQSNDGEAGEGDYVASDVENLSGGNGNDTLTGNGQGNTLSGGIGNDKLDGKGGGEPPGSPGLFVADTLLGGSGGDTINGGPAGSVYDQVDGGIGIDLLTYQTRTDHLEIWLDGGSNQGEDEITGVENVKDGSASNLIVGNGDANVISGYGGNDTILGEGAVDVLYGGDANDSLYGGGAHDLLFGQDGADTLAGEGDDDYFGGGAGFDTATYAAYAAPVTVTLDGSYNDGVAGEGDNVLADVEQVVGGSAGDTITGSSGPNTLTGAGGPDTLNGGSAADTLDGGPGGDELNGGADGDTLIGGTEADQLNGDAGYDSLRGGPGPDQFDGGSESDTANYLSSSAAVNLDLAAGTATGEGSDTLTSIESALGSAYGDTLLGSNGPNTLSGAGGPDSIRGREDNDALNGGDGNDVFRGGNGNDNVSGGSGTDRMDFSNAPAAVTVDLSIFNGPATGEGSDFLTGVEDVDGSAFGDTITGSAVANVLKGLGGGDKLYGLGGDDTLDGGSGTDTLDGGANTDSCLNGETLQNCE